VIEGVGRRVSLLEEERVVLLDFSSQTVKNRDCDFKKKKQ
jgi:hypothetical protein